MYLHNTDAEYLPLDRFDPGLMPRPRGLWYAVDRTWIDWCIANPTLGKVRRNVFGLELSAVNILRITSAAIHDKFTYRYAKTDLRLIDWRRVATDWDGIEVVGLDLVNRHAWSKLFDVPSGCIWTPGAAKVVSITKVAGARHSPSQPAPFVADPFARTIPPNRPPLSTDAAIAAASYDVKSSDQSPLNCGCCDAPEKESP